MGKEATFGRLGNSPAVECLSYSSGDQRSNSLQTGEGGRRRGPTPQVTWGINGINPKHDIASEPITCNIGIHYDASHSLSQLTEVQRVKKAINNIWT